MTKVIPIPSRTATIRLSLVDRDPGQPRKTFKESSIRDLAKNIAANGLLNPIYLRSHPEKSGRYMLVAGERRFQALKFLEVEEFEFRIVEKGLPPYVISIIENSHREGLNPIEEAESYRECMEREKMPVAQLSEYTGKHLTEIYRALRLLKLAPEVQQLVREGKVTRGNLKDLAQFKELSKQIELAQALVRGEDPPELIEAATNTSGWGDDRIVAALPKTGRGLIHRMLEFRGRAYRIGFVFDAFLKLSEADQIQGWTAFTKATRENFASQLMEFATKLDALNKKMATLPETQKAPFGMAIPKAQRSVAPPPPPKPAPPARQTPAPPSVVTKAAPPPRIPDRKPDPPPVRKLEVKRPPTVVEVTTAEKIMGFLSQSMRKRSACLLSKAALLKVLGNGDTPKTIEKTALDGLRAARDVWRKPPNDDDTPAQRAFVMTVSRYRYELGDTTFPLFVNSLRQMDRSADPIDLSRL